MMDPEEDDDDYSDDGGGEGSACYHNMDDHEDIVVVGDEQQEQGDDGDQLEEEEEYDDERGNARRQLHPEEQVAAAGTTRFLFRDGVTHHDDDEEQQRVVEVPMADDAADSPATTGAPSPPSPSPPPSSSTTTTTTRRVTRGKGGGGSSSSSSGGGGALGRTLSIVKLSVQTVRPKYDEPWRRLSQEEWSGTGFLIKGRRILTNAHVVERASHVRARKSASPVMFSCKVEWISEPLDLALLSVIDADAFWGSVLNDDDDGGGEGGGNNANVDGGDGDGDGGGGRKKDGKESTVSGSIATTTKAARPLEISQTLPRLDDNVTCVGFPRGGAQISVTRGVVSRVDVNSSGILRIQIDAAINPGNSGGPVFDETGNVVGVANSHLQGGSNIGYIIPGLMVQEFVRMCFNNVCADDIERSVLPNTASVLYSKIDQPRYVPGVAYLGASTQTLESKALRKSLGLIHDDGHGGGIRIASIRYNPTSGLQPDDVLMKVDGVDVGQDATVRLSETRCDERISYMSLITRHPSGSIIHLNLLRNGKYIDIPCKLNPIRYLVPMYDGFDAHPSYVVVAGCVFVPLSYPWINCHGNADKKNSVNGIFTPYTRLPAEGTKQIIVLSKVLADEVNVGYHSYRWYVLRSVNNVAVDNIRHLVELIVTSSDKPTLDFRLFYVHQEDQEHRITVDMEEVKASEERIMGRHMIAAWCSEEAVPVEMREGSGSGSDGGGGADWSSMNSLMNFVHKKKKMMEEEEEEGGKGTKKKKEDNEDEKNTTTGTTTTTTKEEEEWEAVRTTGTITVNGDEEGGG